MIPEPNRVYQRKHVTIDGLVTGYLEAGTGPTVLLLHSGEFGADAELSWEYTVDALSGSFRVLAPEWLGYGDSAKVHDFEQGTGKLLSHMRRFCEELGIGPSPVVASSLGASMALSDASSSAPQLPASTIVAINGGGEVLRNPDVDALFEFDGSLEAMRRLVRALFVDDIWAQDDQYVRRRHARATQPGAWECVAAPRFHSPEALAGGRPARPKPDYSRIGVPTLIVAGAQDKIKPSGWAEPLAAAIPDCRVADIEGCGHLPHIERAQEVNRIILEHVEEHLSSRHPA
jgi:pimeloyl-ACP methyl ester carboxylesterase